MSNWSPITPPDELFNQWFDNWRKSIDLQATSFDFYVAIQAARWGADQELEACCADVHTVWGKGKAEWLRSMRRPKPPSLKEQALAALEQVEADFNTGSFGGTIRRALEALDD